MQCLHCWEACCLLPMNCSQKLHTFMLRGTSLPLLGLELATSFLNDFLLFANIAGLYRGPRAKCMMATVLLLEWLPSTMRIGGPCSLHLQITCMCFDFMLVNALKTCVVMYHGDGN
ncbi:hypothetical protein KSP40_PGU007065 [Platanthera guangdongensis]|uniref:Uncharacterized protein n=1 Tax=Platanthera guangdongensis TaxID=2320717 RepID=A0ABR2LKY9_9ASPA